MPDPFTPAARSSIMARVRSRGTAPEVRLEALVREILGVACRVEIHREDLPGTPDLVLPTLRVCLFVDGCFWHGCPKHGSVPVANRDYWERKLARNAARDRRANRRLREDGWSVWRVWEHDLRPTVIDATRARLDRRLQRRQDSATT